jgi:hypothetical protein
MDTPGFLGDCAAPQLELATATVPRRHDAVNEDPRVARGLLPSASPNPSTATGRPAKQRLDRAQPRRTIPANRNDEHDSRLAEQPATDRCELTRLLFELDPTHLAILLLIAGSAPVLWACYSPKRLSQEPATFASRSVLSL